MTELGPMQEKFEAWMENPLDLEKNADGKYLDLETCAYWITWQEAFEAGRSSLESELDKAYESIKSMLLLGESVRDKAVADAVQPLERDLKAVERYVSDLKGKFGLADDVHLGITLDRIVEPFEKRAEKVESENERLREALGECYIILEGLRLSVVWELAPAIMEAIVKVCKRIEILKTGTEL